MSAPVPEKEITKLTLQADEYYNSARTWAQVWMILYVLSLCLEIVLVLIIALSFSISYQKELLTSDNMISNLTTWWNVRVLIGSVFLVCLLIIFAASFNKRWRLNQSTMGKLAAFKIDLTDSGGQPSVMRQTLKNIIDGHNQGLKKQKMFKGPELR